MIHCPLDHASRYAPLHPLFAAALRHASDPALRARPPGRYTLDDGLRVNCDAATTEAPDARRFESHRRHIDIQVVIDGGERMQWAWTGDLAPDGAYDPEADCQFHRPPTTIAGEAVVPPESCAIFFPTDAHRPCCHLTTGPAITRKLVFKIPVDAADIARPA